MPIRNCHVFEVSAFGRYTTVREGVYATRRWPRQLRAVALQTTLQPIAASAFAVVYLPKADTSNTSYDTYVGSVNLNAPFSRYDDILVENRRKKPTPPHLAPFWGDPLRIFRRVIPSQKLE